MKEYVDPQIHGLVWADELKTIFGLAQQMDSIVEVGCWKGKSTHALLSGCKGQVTTVDNFRGDSIETEEARLESQNGRIRDIFLRNVGHFKNLRLLEMDSNIASLMFHDNSVDMVFIDGDHSYEATKEDIRLWFPKCRKLLCGHDYDDEHEGVRRAVGSCGHKFEIIPKIMWAIWKNVYNDPEISGLTWPDELKTLFNLAQQMDSVVEIGCWKGRSTHALLSGCKGTVSAIDHFKGSPLEIDNFEKEAKEGKIKEQFLKNVGHFNNLRLFEMSSKEACLSFPDYSVDMVFIDSDHRYESVKEDIELWYPKCRKMLCGHDYDKEHEGVRRAVDSCGYKFRVVSNTIWTISKNV